MALSDLQATVVSSTILASLRENAIAQSIIGAEVPAQNQIGMGLGKVLRVPVASAVTVFDYDPATPISPEGLTPSYKDLTINKAKAWAITLDDTDLATLTVEQFLATHAIEAGRELASSIDTDVLAFLQDEAAELAPATIVEGGLPSDPTAYAMLVKAGAELDKNAVPATGRWCVVGGDFGAQLYLDQRLNRATQAGDSIAGTRVLGQVAGFTVYQSENLPDPGSRVLYGHPIAGSVAIAMNRTEQYRAESYFADVVRSMVVYGRAVFRPEAIRTQEWTLAG